jgi:hypothetical protein
VSEVRLPRRRRSVARSPVVVDPADIPEDAAGRVEVIAIRAPADVIDPGDVHDPPPPRPSRLVELALMRDSWPAVAVIVAVLVVVFVIGMVATR